MKRIAAHYLYINPDLILKKGVIEIAGDDVISGYFSLTDVVVESTNTEFYTGVLAPSFTPFTEDNIAKIPSGFHFIDPSDLSFTGNAQQNYIINTAGLDLQQTARLLWKIQQLLPQATIIDLINWCSYFPENILYNSGGITPGSRKSIWLFEHVDLINMKITPETTIRKV